MRKTILALLMAVLAYAAGTDAAAEENRLRVEPLNTVAGSPRDPDNLKIRVDLPATWARDTIAPGELRFFIYPTNLDPRQGATPRYQAAGVMFWRQGETVYADLRQPPQQDADGDYTLLAVLVRNGVVALSSFGSRPVTYRTGEVDVALVIDSSQSMAKNDPAKRRVAAAQAFIDTAARDGRISTVGLIRFNDEATVLSPLTPLAKKDALLKPLSKINSDGMTNIGKALLGAAELFDGRSKNRRAAVVLLTDGKNESLPYAGEHRVFAERGTPVYCIGLAKEADMRLLQTIAAETGGKVFLAADHRGLMAIYQRIAAEIGRRQTILSRTVTEAEVTVPVPVDAQVRNVSFAIDAGPQEAELILTPPDAATAGDSSQADGQAVEYVREGYRELRVTRPTAGVWLVRVRRLSGSGGVNLSVSGDTKLFLDVFPPRELADGVRLGATLADRSQPLTGRSVVVLPVAGLGQTPLFDDGRHEDGAAGDGVYAGDVLAAQAGRARLLLQATGNSREEFLRQADAGEAYLPHSARALEHSRNNQLAVASSDQPEKAVNAASIAPSSLRTGELDLGALMPGQIGSAELAVRYEGQPARLQLRCEQLKSDKSGVVRHPGILLAQEKDLPAGESRVGVRFLVPADAAAGDYRGQAVAQAGEVRATVPVRLRIMPVTLTAAEPKIDLGFVRGNEPLRFSVPLRLNAPTTLPVHVASEGKVLAVSGAELELTPGRPQVLPLTATLAEGLAPGEHVVRVTLSAGPARQELQVRLLIPEKSSAVRSRLTGHELSLLLPGNIQRYSLQVHELRIPHTVAPVAPESQLVQPQTEEITVPGTGRWVDALLILLAALLLAALLMLLRKLSKNRMTRFALLSVALHLPLLALVAGYLLLAGTAVVQDTPEAFTAALTEAGESVEGGPGVPDKSLLAGAPAQEQNATRFLEPQQPLEPQKVAPAPTVEAQLSKIDLPPSVVAVSQPTPEPLAAEPVRLERVEVPQPHAKRTQPPVRRSQPMPAVMSNAPRPMPRAEAASVVVSATKLAVQPAEQSMERETAIAGSTITGQAQELQLASAREVDVAPVADQDRPQPSNYEHSRTQRREPGRTATAHNAEPVPQRQQELPKVSELPAAGPSASEGRARSVEDSLRVAERNLRAFASDSSGLAQNKTASARTESRSLAEVEGTPERQTLRQTPLSGTMRTSVTPVTGGRADAQPRAPQPSSQAVASQAATAQPVVRAEPGMHGGETRMELAPTARETVRRVSATAVEPEQLAAMIGGAEVSATESSISATAVSGLPANTARRSDATSRPAGRSDVEAPKRPQITVPSVAERTTAGASGGLPGSAKLVAEQRRFAGGGEAAQVSAALAGPAARMESADIAYSDHGMRPQLGSVRTNGLQRAAAGAELAEAGGANAVQIELTAGVVGRPAGNLFSLLEQNLPVHPVAAELTVESLGRCQVVVIADANTPSAAEQQALAQYLREGGRVWFCAGNIPAGLSGLGTFKSVGSEHPFFTAHYDLRRTVARAQVLEGDGLRALSTPVVAPEALPSLAANALAVLLTAGSGARTSVDGMEAAPVAARPNTLPVAAAAPVMASSPSPVQAEIAPLRPEVAAVPSARATTKESETADGLPAELPADPQETSGAVVRGGVRLWQDFTGLADNRHGWSAESWGDPVRIGLADDGRGGSALLAAFTGRKGKAGVSFVVPDYEGRRLDVSAHRQLLVDLYQSGQGQSGVTLLLTTYDPQTGWDEYQTQEVMLRPGWNRDLALNLTPVRSRRAGGAYQPQMRGAEHCAKVTLLLRAQGGNFLIDNLRWSD